MISEDERVSIRFNRKIYKMKKIKRELEKLGHLFRSFSDTEVILKSYQEWGNSMFARLDGMFAICIADLARQKIILGRDRVGMKPLFYHRSGQGLVWASEIKGLLKNGMECIPISFFRPLWLRRPVLTIFFPWNRLR